MIYIFGSTGMLGTYVKKILSNTFDITDITRKEYDILNDECEINGCIPIFGYIPNINYWRPDEDVFNTLYKKSIKDKNSNLF